MPAQTTLDGVSLSGVRQICRALTIACRLQPDHICCKAQLLAEPEALEADQGSIL
jgi:hypothetical protein